MDYDIEIYDGLQPSVEIGYINAVIPKLSRNNQKYGNVLLNVPKRRNNEKAFNIVPFYMAPSIWKRYRAYLKENDLWLFYFKLTGNETGGVHYCNASVTNALKLKPNHKLMNKSQNQSIKNNANGFHDTDHYEHDFF